MSKENKATESKKAPAAATQKPRATPEDTAPPVAPEAAPQENVPPVENVPADTAPPVAPEAAPQENAPGDGSFPQLPKSSATFAPNTVASNPTFVKHNGKKYRINGKHFEINGDTYTDADLALPENAHIIDAWVVTGCGILREVFE